MAYQQPHKNVAATKQLDESPTALPVPSPLLQTFKDIRSKPKVKAKKMKDYPLNTQERRDEYTRRNWKQDETTTVKPVTEKANGWKNAASTFLKGAAFGVAGPALVAVSKHPKVKSVMSKVGDAAQNFVENITKPKPELQTGGTAPIKQVKKKNKFIGGDEYLVADDGETKKKIEGEEMSEEEFFHTGPYDYKLTQNYLSEMRRVTDSLKGSGDIPSIKDQDAMKAYYSGPHREHNYLFPAGGLGLAKWASMSKEERENYFNKKGVNPPHTIN